MTRRHHARHPTAAVVLGAAVWAQGTASPALTRRTQHAISLFHKGHVQRIIASGGLGEHPPTEAEVIAELCTQAGVPRAAVILERRAQSTMENIAFTAPLLQGHAALIVTDRYHAPRAWLTARAYGVRAAVSCPPALRRPTGPALRHYMREAIALPFYALKLGFGRRP